MRISSTIVFGLFSLTFLLGCQSYGDSSGIGIKTTKSTNLKPILALSKSASCGDSKCSAIDVTVKNTLNRAICLPASSLPLDENPIADLLEIRSRTGEEISFNGPSPVILLNIDKGELNYVLAPGNSVTGSIKIDSSFNLIKGDYYQVVYRASARFCNIYDRGNPSALFETDPDFVVSNSIRVESEVFQFYAD